MTHEPKLVGLIGRKGSGKDTAAEALEALGFQNVKFAGALKAMLRTLLAYQGADEETVHRMIDGDLKEVPTPLLSGKTPRLAMQKLGTEWGRVLIGEDFWLSTAMTKAAGGNAVITDVRFPNEVKAIQDAGGVLIRIAVEGKRAFEGGVGEDHASETLVDSLPSDATVINRMAAPGADPAEAISKFKDTFLRTVDELIGVNERD